MENIFLSIIANFLTDFIKKLVGISLSETTSKTRFDSEKIEPRNTISERNERIKKNRNNAANITAIIVMLIMPAILLYGSAYLSMSFPNILSSSIELETTRLGFLSGKLEKNHLAFFFTLIFYLPIFMIAQILTQYISGYIDREWMNMTTSRLVRLFGLSIFFLVVPYSGFIIYFLHPHLTVFGVLKIPAIALVFMFWWAYAEQSH